MVSCQLLKQINTNTATKLKMTIAKAMWLRSKLKFTQNLLHLSLRLQSSAKEHRANWLR